MKRDVLVRAGWTIAGLAVVAALVLWMSGFFAERIPPGGLEAEAPPLAAGAATARVTEEIVPVVEEAAGTVEAERRTVISSRILATIASVYVKAGQEVAAGDPLIQLDDRSLATAVEQAQRAVDAAAATRARRAADFERARQLWREGVLSRSEFETSEAAAKVAEAQLESARQGLTAAQVAQSYAVITSPVAGRVVDRFADPGDTAAPGEPLLAIYDPTALRIEAAVRESLAASLAVGDPVGVRLQGSDETVDGVIGEIVPEAAAGSRTVLVKVRLPARADLFTGMFGRVLLPVGERTALTLPENAIERVGQLVFVTALSPQGVPGRRLVTVGKDLGAGKVEILSGLRAGEEVVVPG